MAKPVYFIYDLYNNIFNDTFSSSDHTAFIIMRIIEK